MSVLGALRTDCLEVKFLDAIMTNCSEGVLWQGHDCQSRTRVWGSKMIRYRRSPFPVNVAGSVWDAFLSKKVACSVPPSLIEKSEAFGFRGEYIRKAET